MPHRLVILAGHHRSRATLVLLNALSRLDPDVIQIKAVVSVSRMNWRRAMMLYRRFGNKLKHRVLSEFGFSRGTAFDEERAVYESRLRQIGNQFESVKRFCAAQRIPLHEVSDINGRNSLRLVERCDADLAIYSGAGILSKSLLRVGPRVLNVHCGPLPHVRGMNAAEWSLYFGFEPEATIHFIDAGIDTGEILGSRTVGVRPDDTIAKIRANTALAGIDLLVEMLPEIDEITPIQNPSGAGKQYFAMAEPIKQLVQSWIRTGQTPVCAASKSDPADIRPAICRNYPRAALVSG